MLHSLRECTRAARDCRQLLQECRGDEWKAILNEAFGIVDEDRPGRHSRGHRFNGRRVVDPYRVNFRDLFEAFVDDGAEVIREHRHGRSWLQESGGAINTSMFSAITGQIAYSRFLEKLDQPEFIAMDLVTTVPASTQYSEQIPGVTAIGDKAGDVGEGQEYPRLALSDQYITVERKVKDGFIADITEETIFEDKTGQVLAMIDKGTESLAITMEKEILDTVTGITSRYSRNGGAVQATYGDTHTEGTFDNLVASNTLVDYTDIDAALQAFDAITDPDTGEPIIVGGPLDLLVPRALYLTASNILESTTLKIGADSASVQMMTNNPLGRLRQNTINPDIKSNQYVSLRTSSNTTWFIGNFRKAFQYLEIWPPQKITSDRSDIGFRQDIVTSVKFRRKGVPAVVEPRVVVKCTT